MASSSADAIRANLDFFDKIDTVDGWLEPTAAFLSALLMHHQNALGIRGNIAEIGVFKGRYFLTLATCLKHSEIAIAIDVFDDFEKSEDAEGYKALGAKADFIKKGFMENTSRFLPPSKMSVIHADSATLTAADVRASGGPFRFFSVDGGHSRAMVKHDLELADKALSDEGILSIDDFQNMQWPGVITAFFDYLPTADFVPFAIIPNKLLCCRPDHAKDYQAFLRTSGSASLSRKDLELGNSPVDLHGNWMTREQFIAAIHAITDQPLR